MFEELNHRLLQGTVHGQKLTRAYIYIFGSDHFLIIVTIIGREEETKVQIWQIKKANWYQFQTLCYERFACFPENSHDAMQNFTETLISMI